MPGYAVFVHKGEIIVAHGAGSARQLVNRLSDAIASGEAMAAVVRRTLAQAGVLRLNVA